MCSSFCVHIVPDHIPEQNWGSLGFVRTNVDSPCKPVARIPLSNVHGLTSEEDLADLWLQLIHPGKRQKTKHGRAGLGSGQRIICVPLDRIINNITPIATEPEWQLGLQVVQSNHDGANDI